MKLIDRHLLATFVPPFLFGLSVTTFLLMINVLQVYINLFLEKGISVLMASEVLVLSLGHTLALTVPMASLIGVLMAIGHLAGDQEITALKACGTSLYRISLPLVLTGVVLSASMVAYNHWVLPDGNHRLKRMLFQIQQMRPTLDIRPNTFAEISDRYTIFVRHKDDIGGMLEDVVLYQREGRGDLAPDVVVARTGRLITLGPSRIRLDLMDGEIHRIPDANDPTAYNRTRFARQTFMMNLDEDQSIVRRSNRRGEREMDLHMLSAAVAKEESLAVAKIETARGHLEDVVMKAYQERDPSTAPGLGATRTALDEYNQWSNMTSSRERSLSLNYQTARDHRTRAAKYAVEWHKKFSIAFACTVFAILGVPLAVVSSRGGRGVSVGLSLFAFVVYYVFLSSGEKLADRGHLVPWVAMWSPNIVLGIAGTILLIRAVHDNPSIDFGAVFRVPPLRWILRGRTK